MKTPDENEFTQRAGDELWVVGCEQDASTPHPAKRGFCGQLKAALDRVLGELRARYEALLPGRAWLIARTLQEAEREAWATGWPQVVLADIVEHRLGRLVAEVAGGGAGAGAAGGAMGDGGWGMGEAKAAGRVQLWYGAGAAENSAYHRGGGGARKAQVGFWPPQARPTVARRPGPARDGFPAYPREHGQAATPETLNPLWLR